MPLLGDKNPYSRKSQPAPLFLERGHRMGSGPNVCQRNHREMLRHRQEGIRLHYGRQGERSHAPAEGQTRRTLLLSQRLSQGFDQLQGHRVGQLCLLQQRHRKGGPQRAPTHFQQAIRPAQTIILHLQPTWLQPLHQRRQRTTTQTPGKDI